MGGTVTGEHGVGVEKLNSMCVQFSAAENEQMFGIKRAFDPQGLLNPGKVIPTLQRCAEYGKELVRAGKLKHPDLPRFCVPRASTRRVLVPWLHQARLSHKGLQGVGE